MRLGLCGMRRRNYNGKYPSGTVYMAAFGAGTVPMMLAIGIAGRLIPVSFRTRLRVAIPVSIFLLGALLVLRGMDSVFRI